MKHSHLLPGHYRRLFRLKRYPTGAGDLEWVG